jgi:hypothetical protein
VTSSEQHANWELFLKNKRTDILSLPKENESIFFPELTI